MCTSLSLLDASNAVYVGRTMEFAGAFPWQLSYFPQGLKFTSAITSDQNGISYQNSLAFIGITLSMDTSSSSSNYQEFKVVHGLNEAGLNFGANAFPLTEGIPLADAQYPTAESASAEKPALYNLDFCEWVLGNFDTLETLQEALSSVTVISSTELTSGADILIHYIATDSSGGSLIIEYANGTLQTYESANGVMTNTPTYPWHLNNLVNYLPLSLENSPNEMWGGQINGSGLLGMQGDYVSPNRFIRTWYLQQSTTQYSPQNLGEAVGLAARILQNCAMPIGSTKMTGLAADECFEYTQFGVIRDHQNFGYYFFTQFNNSLFFIDLTKIDFSKVSAAISTVQPQWSLDITEQLLKA